ncbi:beta-lactamase family protein [Lysobacter sp. MMG2]|uniref:serine hydrolase domain-containing protein n=1 Tax=Lysobacter sp. MMG2 TaxID=2801338 RepID=UPI001C2391D4|nr:serine hydrolase domain-containing protein [Lysobacter sp. MMG2]MBU8976555.1 beta-lactamase family protein [Lysobacter sp. MMG2]
MKKWILGCLALWPALAMAQTVSTAAFIEAYAGEHDFSGTVLVERAGRVEYERSFGLANRAFAVPNTPDTRYWIGSITKLFTATLVMQLVEEGRLNLDAPIRTVLPDYAGEGREATVRQLLNHTSGIANFDTVTDAATALREGIPAYQLPHDSGELLRRYASGKRVHAPGTTFDYNNGDYVILGKIVERATGMPFEQALSRRILAPLKLADTGMLRQAEILPRLANTYFVRESDGALINDLPVYPENWYAAGAMYSTVRDLRVFADALYGGRLIGEDSLKRMLAPGLDDYGFGVWSYESTIAGKPHRIAKRPGRIMGAQAQLYRLLDDEVTVVILANVGNTDLDEFVARIGRVVLSGRPER